MLRVLVVDEVRAIGEMIASALRSDADLRVVACATNLDEAAAHLGRCDLAVVHAGLMTDSSAHLVRGLRRLAPRVKIVVMGMARSELAIFRCVEAGVAGYVFQDSLLNDLIQRIRTADRNEALAAPPLAAMLVGQVAKLAGVRACGESEPGGSPSLTRGY